MLWRPVHATVAMLWKLPLPKNQWHLAIATHVFKRAEWQHLAFRVESSKLLSIARLPALMAGRACHVVCWTLQAQPWVPLAGNHLHVVLLLWKVSAHCTSQVMVKPQLECSPADGAFSGIFCECPNPSKNHYCRNHDPCPSWHGHSLKHGTSIHGNSLTWSAGVYHQAAWMAQLAVCSHIAFHSCSIQISATLLRMLSL